MKRNKLVRVKSNTHKNLCLDIEQSNQGRRNFLKIIGLAGLSIPLISGTSKANDISELVSAFKMQIKKEFLAAALKERVKVDERSISIGILSEGLLISAALEGLATVDMIEYEKGVPTNFIYVDSKATSLKSGFYKVTTLAQKVRLGRITIKAEYSQEGKVVQTSSGVAQVYSLKVPTTVNPETPVKVGVSMEQSLERGYYADPIIVITAVCPNAGNTRIELPRAKG